MRNWNEEESEQTSEDRRGFIRRLTGLTTRGLTLVIGGAALVLVLMFSGMIFEYLSADGIMVIQAPLSGELTWYTEPGLKVQWFGKVTHYPRSWTFWFSSAKDQGKASDQSIKTRFYDGGHGFISGSAQIDMPLDVDQLTTLHKKFGSPDAIDHAIVRTTFERSVYMSGPLMSSKESYAEKRPLLIFYIEDQAHNGVYQTTTQDSRVKDPFTGVEKTVTLTKIIESRDAPGGMMRQEISPLSTFGLKAYNMTINDIRYDDIVEKQITQQQEAIMAIQTAVARAKEAEQDAITNEQRGRAEAAKAKWNQEILKAKAVTEAQQKLEVAELNKKEAEQTKQKEILLGEGESQRRKLLMSADNQLEIKLKYWLEAQKAYAEAFGHQKWVPNVQFGSTSGPTGGAVVDFMNLLTMKAAKDLDLNLNPKQQQ